MTRKAPFFQVAVDNIVSKLMAESLLKPSGSQFWEALLMQYADEVQLVIREHEQEVLPMFSVQEQEAYREAMSNIQATGLNKLKAEILYVRGGKLDFSTS